MFSPSLVAKRNPISSASAPTSRANCPRTSSVFLNISSSGIGFDALRSANARAASSHGHGNRRDVRRVQVEPVAHDRKVTAHAQGIVRIVPIGLRTLRLQGGERSSSSRDADELPTIELHVHLAATRPPRAVMRV